MKKKNLPIKPELTDSRNSLSRNIDKIQSVFGIHKTALQVIHYIHERGCIHIDELKMLMHPFADAPALYTILAKLKITCVIFNPEDKVTLTTNGTELYKSCMSI